MAFQKGKIIESVIRDFQGLGMGGEKLSTKGNERTFWNNGNILYLDCDGGGYMTVYLSKLIYQYTQKDEF